MSKRQYKRGARIESVADFEQSTSQYYIVYFGSTNPQTKHRAFLISWQYRVLQGFISRGWVFEADKMDEEANT